MHKRIFGMHTEFAVIPEDDSSIYNIKTLFLTLKSAISKVCPLSRADNVKFKIYFENKSSLRLYQRKEGLFTVFVLKTIVSDCTSPREFLACQRLIEDKLNSPGTKSEKRVFFFKTSSDIFNNSYISTEFYNILNKKNFLSFLSDTAVLLLSLPLFAFIFMRKVMPLPMFLNNIFKFVPLWAISFSPVKKEYNYLMPHLITRIIYTGPGYFNDKAEFLLSPEAEKVTFMFDPEINNKTKGIFKSFYDFSSYFNNSSNKVEILFSDPLMCQISDYLKFGTTLIIIDMIEKGADLSDLALMYPFESIKKINRDLFFDNHYLTVKGEKKSVLQIQTELFNRAENFVLKEKIQPMWAIEVIKRWKEVLDLYSKKDHRRLSGVLDWPSKLDLMITASSGVNVFEIKRYMPVIDYLEQKGINSTLFIMPPLKMPGAVAISNEETEKIKKICKENFIDPQNISRAARAFFACKKVDASFQDISKTSGYQRGLEADGYFEKIITEDEISYFQGVPPNGEN